MAGWSDHLSACSNPVGHLIACARQSSDQPPEPVVLDLRNGATRALFAINPQVADIRLSRVSEVRWTDTLGGNSNGYLIKPLAYERGRRYPLVVALYGFEGRFVAAAEWLSSYPVQALARDGISVLLSEPSAGHRLEASGTGPVRCSYGIDAPWQVSKLLSRCCRHRDLWIRQGSGSWVGAMEATSHSLL